MKINMNKLRKQANVLTDLLSGNSLSTQYRKVIKGILDEKLTMLHKGYTEEMGGN